MESIEERKNREEAEKRAIEERRTETKLNKSATEIALVSGDANRFIAEVFVEQKANSGASAKDKNFSRKVLREVKRYERTGRVSSWLASEFTKAQALRETTLKKAQEQPESVPPSSLGAAIPIPNAPTNYEFKPIELKGGGGATDRHPFQISTRTDEEGNIKLTVNVGTLNSLLPSNVFDGPALREFSVGSGLKYVVLTGTSDGEQFTSCSLSVESTAVQPQSPTVFGLPTTAAFLLGVVYNGSVFQVQKTNLLVTGKQQYVKQKATPAVAGTLPYEIYYVWG